MTESPENRERLRLALFPKRAYNSSTMYRWLLLAFLAITTAACLTIQRQGGIRIESNVPDATLYVDEELKGPVRAYQEQYVHVDPGTHRVTIEHPEHFTEFVEVDVPANMAVKVRVELRRRPD